MSIPPLPLDELAAAEATALQSSTSGARPEQMEVEALSTRQSKRQLEDAAAASEHRRNENFRDHFERLAICGLWIAAIALILIGSIWLLHMVLPASWRWLTSEDLSHIQSIVTAGVLAGVVGNHFKKRLG